MGKAIPLEEQKERLVGKRFGTLTVVGYAGHGKWNHKWKCTCDCGWHDCKGNVVVEGGMHSLESGKKTSCSGAHKRINLRGRVFDKLTVLEFAYIDKAIYWKCRCNCGHPLCKGTVIKKGWEMIEYEKQGLSNTCGAERHHYQLQGFTRDEGYKLTTDKTSAATRGIEWELTDSQAVALYHAECYYSGCDSTKCAARNGNGLNGIDRVDNTKGYTLANSVSACWQHNVNKHAVSIGQAKRMLEHHSMMEEV